jgi:hypothetical protein
VIRLRGVRCGIIRSFHSWVVMCWLKFVLQTVSLPFSFEIRRLWFKWKEYQLTAWHIAASFEPFPLGEATFLIARAQQSQSWAHVESRRIVPLKISKRVSLTLSGTKESLWPHFLAVHAVIAASERTSTA